MKFKVKRVNSTNLVLQVIATEQLQQIYKGIQTFAQTVFQIRFWFHTTKYCFSEKSLSGKHPSTQLSLGNVESEVKYYAGGSQSFSYDCKRALLLFLTVFHFEQFEY